MISWIQRTFQQHFRWMFGILLFATIISFVFIYNPASGIGTSEGSVGERPFFGMNLNSSADFNRAANDAGLSVTLQVGFMGFSDTQLQQYTLQRVAALALAERHHLQGPDSEELVNYIQTLRAFSGPDGKYDRNAYEGFRTSVRAGQGGVTEGDVLRVISDDWRIDQVQRLLGGPGYVMAPDIQERLSREGSTWTLGVATADYTAFDPQIDPSAAELEKHFADYAFQYEIPPQVRVSYVEFPLSAYQDRTPVTPEQVRAYYDRNPARFPKPAATPPAAATPAPLPPAPADANADFAAVEPQVRAALRDENARRLADKDASDLTIAIDERKVSRDNLDAFLAERKLTKKAAAPFSQSSPPAELGGPAASREAFRLSADRFASDPLRGPTAAYVLFWEETLPVRPSLLADVRDRVLADYRENEKRKRFVELGRTVKSGIETRLRNGASFTDAAAAAAAEAGLKVEAKVLPALSLKQPGPDAPPPVLGTLERLEKGQVSDMVVAGNMGYIVHAADRQLPDLSPANPVYNETAKALADNLARFNANTLLGELVADELQKTEPPAAAATP